MKELELKKNKQASYSTGNVLVQQPIIVQHDMFPCPYRPLLYLQVRSLCIYIITNDNCILKKIQKLYKVNAA
jgi:hypothetical protein